jgi:hypothetical protein
MATNTNQNIDSNMRLKGKPSTWPKILAALVVLALIAWLVAKGLAKRNVSTNALQGAASGAAGTVKSAVTDFSSFVSNKQSTDFKGQAVQFSNLSVKSVGTNDQTFWVNNAGAANPSQTAGRDLFVHMSPQVQAQAHQAVPSIQNGMKVNVSGTLKVAPSVSDMQSQWQLNSNDANYLASGDNMYLEADNVQVAQ